MIITGKKFSKPSLCRVINGDTPLPAADQPAPRTRLDHLLVTQHPEYNRSTLQNFIKSGYVTVNDKIIKKPNADIPAGATITLTVPNRTPPPDLAQLKLYEDDNVIVLNKPAGLLSMKKGQYSPEPTLEDYGLLVHRLDRATSGVVILAKNPATQSYLRRQFQDRHVHKTYYAVIVGHPKHDQALIDLPLARNLHRPTTFKVDPSGKPAQTSYRLLTTTNQPLPPSNTPPTSQPTTSTDSPTIPTSQSATSPSAQPTTYSLLELKPTTGRTHQLRVHLNYLGTPILGDPIYGADHQPTSSPQSAHHSHAPSTPTRLYLHAHSLEITLPGGDRRTFTAPLPPEFTALFPHFTPPTPHPNSPSPHASSTPNGPSLTNTPPTGNH